MARFSPTFIDEVLSRTDIVEIVAKHVELKRSGSNWMGLCPFHHEKSASFSVSADKQFFYCFGCGKGGSAFQFLMEHDGYSFPEVVTYLAEKAGMELPRKQDYNRKEEQQKASERQQALALLAQTSQAFQTQLQAPTSQHVQHYIQQRGLPDHIIQHYQLGFAPAGYGFMAQHFGNHEDTLMALEHIGMLFKGERGYGDRFRNRLIFPIRDRRGDIVGFGGRTMQDDHAKYLNSPETPYFHKSELLYGYSEHREHIRKRKSLLIVEGYMDVLALAAFDLPIALAPLGTAIGESQLRQIFRLCESPIFCFDGDRAGYQAAWRALERMLPLLKSEHRPRFLYLPDGEDPDSLVQKEGKEAFEHRLEHEAAPSLDTWLLGLQRLAGSGADGLARMAKKADKMLSTMTDDYLKQAWTLEVEKKTSIQLQVSTAKQPVYHTPVRTTLRALPSMLSESFLAALLQKPERIRQLPDEAKDFILDNEYYHKIYTHVFSLQGFEAYNSMTWARQWQRECPEIADNIARWMTQEPVSDLEFTSLLLDMRTLLLAQKMTMSHDLSEIATLKKLETMLKHEQKEINAEMDDQRRGNE
ncbi:MAG: DNA primase [Mariprofundaceae bacterium]|nr:DNA primase [Mariprofundaceae bacterium]